MAIKKLHPYHAFNPGADIWILPEKKTSLWACALDWHINFLISKIQSKKEKEIPLPIQNTLSFEEMEMDTHPQYINDKVLLSTHEYLPNLATIILKDKLSIEKWTDSILILAQDLKSRSIRIFLPKSYREEDFLKSALTKIEDLDISYVEDSPTNT